MINFKVLIAEDEPLVARFIRQIVDGVEGVETAVVCGSGEDACDYMQTNPVHILVTDIHMHGMTGLELIAAAKKLKPELQVIVVSGYSLFSYAKEALRLGVEDYLLKPIDPDELSRSIANMQALLCRQYNEKTNRTLIKLLRAKDYASVAALFESDAVNVLFVNQSGDPESTLELCSNAISEMQNTQMNIALWNRSVLILAPANGEADPFLPLRQWLRRRAGTKTLELLYTGAPIAKAELAHQLPRLHRISREERVLGRCVEHAIYADTEHISVQHRAMLEFPDSVLSGKPARMKEAYTRLFAEWEKAQFTVRELRTTLFALLERLNQLYTMPYSLPTASEQIAECIKYADSFGQARDTSWEIIADILHASNHTQEDARIDLRSLFECIGQFLQSNYSQNYSLQEISQRFHVSQPYISRAFRAYAGVTYKEFCIQQKIDFAKQLISAQPGMMFKDVALQVGIDPAYFGTVFHRVTGQYPSEFKTVQESET